MNRPTLKDFHQPYTTEYASALDKYIDHLESSPKEESIESTKEEGVTCSKCEGQGFTWNELYQHNPPSKINCDTCSGTGFTSTQPVGVSKELWDSAFKSKDIDTKTAEEFFRNELKQDSSEKLEYNHPILFKEIIAIMNRYASFKQTAKALDCPHCGYVGTDFKEHDYSTHETKIK